MSFERNACVSVLAHTRNFVLGGKGGRETEEGTTSIESLIITHSFSRDLVALV